MDYYKSSTLYYYYRFILLNQFFKLVAELTAACWFGVAANAQICWSLLEPDSRVIPLAAGIIELADKR